MSSSPPPEATWWRRARTRAQGSARPWSQWPLRAKLVASMLVLFTVISLAIAALTVVALDRYLTNQVDDQLRVALSQWSGPSPGPRPGFDDGLRRLGPGAEGLVAFQIAGSRTGYATTSDNELERLGTEQLARLWDADLGIEATEVELGDGFGRYRVMAVQGATSIEGLRIPATAVVGLPTAPTDRTVGRMVVVAVLGVGAGMLFVGSFGTWLVRRNLEPLRRVAATATRVSRMPLARGQVALAERVGPADTDTRTEVGQVGAAFNEMLDHVDAALTARHESEQRVRQFVADASHELRTPLASIKGYAELSRREPDPVPDSVRHALLRVESEADRMSALVDDLLLLARLDAGRPLDAARVDLSMVVVNAMSDAHAASPEHAWALDLPPEPVEVRGDEARLHQVVVNLLANARTHTPPGTRVTTSVRPEDGWVRLSVHDNGPGVPEPLQPHVFERFARGDDSRSRAAGSTGLGLSIVAAVARAHGGRVDLASRPGDTTFTLLLPAG